jgi:hypothetical protein
LRQLRFEAKYFLILNTYSPELKKFAIIFSLLLTGHLLIHSQDSITLVYDYFEDRLDLEPLAPGFYILELVSANRRQVSKIINR